MTCTFPIPSLSEAHLAKDFLRLVLASRRLQHPYSSFCSPDRSGTNSTAFSVFENVEGFLTGGEGRFIFDLLKF